MINKNNVFRSLSRIISIILIFLLYVSIFPASTPAKAANSPGARVVVSLGDSYSSGEGIEPFYDQNLPTEQKVNSQDWLSHRSTKSWPGLLYINNKANNACCYLAQNMYDKSRNDQEVCWYFAAVSGAESKHLDEKQTKNYYLKDNGKVYKGSKDIDEQLAVFQIIKDNKQTVDYVTLTMGGNDVGFSEVISDIAIKSFYITPNSSSKIFYEKLELLENETIDKLTNTYRKIHEIAGEQASIIVAGYPRLFASAFLTPGSAGLLFNEAERTIVNLCVDKLNSEINKIVSSLQEENIDIHFVSVTEAFEGHGAYSINPYINPVSIIPKSQDIDCRIKNEKGINSSDYSIHPNQKGAEAYAACVQAKIDELEPMKLQNQTNNTNWQSAAFELLCNAPDYGLEISDILMSVELIDTNSDDIPEIFFGTYMGATGVPNLSGYFYYNGSRYIKGTISGASGDYPIHPRTDSNGQTIFLTNFKEDNDFFENIPQYSSYWYSGVIVSQVTCSKDTANLTEIANFTEYQKELMGFYSEDDAETQRAQDKWDEFRQKAIQFNSSYPYDVYYNYVVSDILSLDICSADGYKSAMTPSYAQSVVDQYTSY